MVFALSGVLAMPAPAFAQLSVDELEVFLRPDQPASRSGAIRVTNHSTRPLQALIEIQDWDRDSTGANKFYKLGQVGGSCRDKLKVFPLSLRIEAGKTESVRITFDGDASDSCWGILFIQSNETPRPAGGQSSITYVIRTGVKVYVEPRNVERVGDIDDVTLSTAPVSDTDTTRVPALAVMFRNSGAAHLKPKGAVELRADDNRVVAKIDIGEFPVAPGGKRLLKLVLPKLNAGRYVALALLDYGGADIAAGQYEFEIR
jgi:P pilus assembly chaperone PapD